MLAIGGEFEADPVTLVFKRPANWSVKIGP